MTPHPPPERPVVLVAEDEALVRLLAVEVLDEAGFDVVETASGVEALSVLQARSDVDLLLTDVDMPGGLDGFHLARLAEERFPGTAVLIVSGKMRPGPADLPPGAFFLPKPYGLDVLVRVARAMIGRAG